jgi:hypothetical protein
MQKNLQKPLAKAVLKVLFSDFFEARAAQTEQGSVVICDIFGCKIRFPTISHFGELKETGDRKPWQTWLFQTLTVNGNQ